jgi:hypothetical protein
VFYRKGGGDIMPNGQTGDGDGSCRWGLFGQAKFQAEVVSELSPPRIGGIIRQTKDKAEHDARPLGVRFYSSENSEDSESTLFEGSSTDVAKGLQ